MQETNTVSANVETQGATSEVSNATQEAPPVVKSSKRERKARRKAQLASKGADKSTSKARKRRTSTVACKSKRHVLVATDKRGAETFATGRNELSRAAKINAVLLAAGRPLAVREIQEKLDAIYGANEVRAVANHMRKLLVEKLVTLSEGRYALIKSKAPKTEKAPAPSESSESNASE